MIFRKNLDFFRILQPKPSTVFIQLIHEGSIRKLIIHSALYSYLNFEKKTLFVHLYHEWNKWPERDHSNRFKKITTNYNFLSVWNSFNFALRTMKNYEISNYAREESNLGKKRIRTQFYHDRGTNESCINWIYTVCFFLNQLRFFIWKIYLYPW